MKDPVSHIALVLFARSAQEEACHKNLVPGLGARRQQQVFEAFNHHTLALLAATGLPYFLVSSDQQQGHTFGERLHQALARTFHQGFEQVIVIGNDCPQLNVQDLHYAAAMLQQHDSVLGPCSNGGVYLLGLSKTLFRQAGSFSQVAWQTPLVEQQLKSLLQQGGGSLLSLPTYHDINTARDFRQAHRHQWFTRSLRNWLSRLLDLLVPQIRPSDFVCTPIHSHPAALFRGPPLYR